MQPKPIIVLDESTYLISGNKSIPSILQKVWDEKLKNTQIMMVLCGSGAGPRLSASSSLPGRSLF
jgi:hypothetical protein